MVATRKRTKTKNVMSMKSGSPTEIGNMNSLIEKGPTTIVLVFSWTCPHCTSYMPIWKKLCNTPNRKANMISMEASTYQNTPLAEKKQMTGVPSVLRVNTSGEITEIMDPRNMETMTATITEKKNPLRPVLGTPQWGGSASNPWLAFLRAKTMKRNRHRN